MQKYIKVTGIATHKTFIFPAYNIKEIIKGVGTVKVQYMNADSSHDTISISYTASGSKDIAMANFVKDLIMKVQSSSYTRPYLSIAATDFPNTVTNVTPPSAS